MRFKVPKEQPGSFRSCALYLAGLSRNKTPDRVLWFETRNLMTDKAEAAAAIMEATANSHAHRCEKTAYHFILSFDPQDDKAGRVSEERMREIADRTITEMGLEHHQAMIFAHRDTEHPHIHFLFNRIHPTEGRAFNRHNDGRRLTAHCKDMALEYGLNVLKERSRNRDQERELADERGMPPSDGEYWQAKKDGRTAELTLDKADIAMMREQLAPVFEQATSWDDVVNGLEPYGLRLKRKGQGLVIASDRHTVKLSDMGKGVRLKELERRFSERFSDWAREKIVDLRRAADPSAQNAVVDLDVADMTYRRWVGVEEQVVAADRNYQFKIKAEDRAQKALAKAKDWEVALEKNFLDALGVSFRDAAAAKKAWMALEAKTDAEQAVAQVRDDPKILGLLQGREGTEERKKALRYLRYLKARRLKWKQARERLQALQNELDRHRSQLARAKDEYERTLSAAGGATHLAATIREKVLERAQAMSRVSEKMIREANITDERRKQLLKAYERYTQRQADRRKERQRERERDRTR